ncbi:MULTISPECIES: hypothetical protein [Amycolatopsis]|uniref:Streptomyces killer toxin-like beta/gamma crystallin domain-containing protein n=1 Tax=Amycolatopsis bullii TaxID=941987 RepID=A0ABQ3KJ72_9PSEU|nr:hypothetical protein [Amycolatopsis bullii]GHG29835.1 hypothetical protein GCM10017567_56970 [Amycolatopsis bullii]
MRKSITAAVAATAAAGAMLVATSEPAFAADDHYCTVKTKTCTAGSTPASASHQIFLATGTISSNYQIKVVDVNNGKTVYSGYFNSALWKGLSNVYSAYDATIICDVGCPGATVHIWR